MSPETRHIYVGLSHKVWCGAKLGTHRNVMEQIDQGRLLAPSTEGEYYDKVVVDVCEDCATALRGVRGPR